MKPIYRHLVLACALFGGASLTHSTPARADEVQVAPEAREKFRAGVALLKDPEGARYEDAYMAFKAAYAISPSPNILGNLGLCAMKLERDGEAIEAYTSYLAKGTNLGDDEKKQIETDLATMKTTLSTIEIKTDPPGALVIDERVATRGENVRNRYGTTTPEGLKLGVRAGVHRITLSLDGYVEQKVEIEVAAGKTESRTIKLEKPTTTGPGPGPGPGPSPGPQEMERPIPIAMWVTLGLTGAFAIGTGVTGGLALANKSEFDDANSGTDPTAAKDLRDKGQALNITTDVLMGTTVAAGAVTLILFLTRPEVPKEKATATQVYVVPTGTGLSVLGSF